MNKDLLVSKLRVKMFLKQQNIRVSHDFYDALNVEIKELLLKAAKRANGNKRTTVLAFDV